jgi:hypothetical protein
MNATTATGSKNDGWLAQVATAVYHAAAQHGFKDAFIDVELDVWYALQTRLRRGATPPAQDPVAEGSRRT